MPIRFHYSLLTTPYSLYSAAIAAQVRQVRTRQEAVEQPGSAISIGDFHTRQQIEVRAGSREAAAGRAGSGKSGGAHQSRGPVI